MESEDESMETLKAAITEVEGKHFIQIEDGDSTIRIPMSEDNPNAVKAAFNTLITRMKDGEFQIELSGTGADLFSQVADEYLAQLNREIKEVRGEMQHYGLA